MVARRKYRPPPGSPFKKGENIHSTGSSSTSTEAPAAKRPRRGRPPIRTPTSGSEPGDIGEGQCSIRLHPDDSCRGVQTRLMYKKIMESNTDKVDLDLEHEYIIAHKEMLNRLWNSGFRGHIVFKPECTGDLLLEKSRQFGISSCWRLKCQSCDYVTAGHALYVEEKRSGPGPRQSTLNLALGVALANSSIGMSSMHEILLTLGCDPGSLSCMTKSHNRACDLISELGEENMQDIRKQLKILCEQGGLRLSILQDTQYNNRPGTIDTPFQAASQSDTSTIENITGKGLVIHVISANKLCRRGHQIMLARGIPDCPKHKDGSRCTATIPMSRSIGAEGEYMKETAKVLKKDGLDVGFVTTDGDTAISDAVLSEFGTNVEHFKDTRHFSRSIKKALCAAKFSTTMFKAEKAADRTKDQKSLAEDIRKRISFEFNEALQQTKHLPDSDRKLEMLELLRKTPDTIINCLRNDHSGCSEFLCTNAEKLKRLKGKNKIEMTKADEKVLREIIQKRLGKDGIARTWRGENTQKCEALHRMYLKVCPKQVTYIRNHRGRIMRAVLVKNLGFDGSTTMILQRIGHAVSGKIKQKMNTWQKLREYRLKYQTLQKAKKARIQKREAVHDFYRRRGEVGELYGNNAGK